MIRINCPHCQTTLEVADDQAGQAAPCPHCGGTVTLPALAPPLARPAGSPPPLPATRSGMATAALVLGIIGLVTSCVGVGIILGIIALVLGILAQSDISRSQGQRTGSGRATAGIVLGVCTVVAIPIIALLIGILLPALGAARRTANQMKNCTQIRGIIQGNILYAQGNSDYYAGFTSTGVLGGPVAASPTTYGSTRDGSDPATRYAILLNGQYFLPSYLHNPADQKQVAVLDTNVDSGQFSYALLEISGHPGDIRNNDWKDTTNSQAAVMGDRNLGPGVDNTSGGAQSLWTSSPGAWRGAVGWNDNHVEFETTPVVNTKYTGGLPIATDYRSSWGSIQGHRI